MSPRLHSQDFIARKEVRRHLYNMQPDIVVFPVRGGRRGKEKRQGSRLTFQVTGLGEVHMFDSLAKTNFSL